MPTPFTDAPDALLHLWNKFALRRGVDAQNLPDSVQDAYNQVLVLQLKDVRDAVETMNADIRRLEAETLSGGRPTTSRDVCAVWGQSVGALFDVKRDWGHVLSGVRRAAVAGGNQ